MDYQLFYLSLMEKREELLWRKLKVQITPNHHNMRLRRASTDGVTNYQALSFNNHHDQSSQVASPTFRKHASFKSEVGQEVQQSFSFGQQMLYDIQHMLKLPSHENHFEKNYLSPTCAQCQTMCTPRNSKVVPRAIVDQIVLKMNNFVVEAKYIIEALKLGLNSYKESFECEKQNWVSSLHLILANVQSKKQHQKRELQQKIQKMEQQNYFNGEKYKILQKKSSSLERELNQLIHNLNIERMNNETLNKKVFQINQQLHSKITQNTKLLQTNCSLKLRLTNYIKDNIDEISQLPPPKIQNNDRKQKVSKLGLQLNELGGFRSKFSKSQYDTGSPNYFQVPSSSRECFPPEFTQSLTFSNVKNEEKMITSPILKADSNCSNNSSKILQQKQKNCVKLNKLLSEPKVQLNKKIEGLYDNSSKTSRKNSSHSIISQIAQRRGSLNITYGQEDKNKILDKIKKLKEDISTQIYDLAYTKKDRY